MLVHPSTEQLARYKNRMLLPGELVAIDSHLGSCKDCRRELSGMTAPSSGGAVLSGVREALSEHLTYEQMDAWVEDDLEQPDRELVMAHIGACSACARQLKAYEGYAPAMSVPVSTAVPLGERIREFFRSPRMAVAATALAAIVVLSPFVVRNLPEMRRDSVAAVHNKRPVNLTYPVAEEIEETQPVLKWKDFGGPYVVSVYDRDHRMVAHSEPLSENRWKVPVALDRGAVYTWELQTGEHATFTVTP